MLLKISICFLVCLVATAIAKSTEEKLAETLFKDYNPHVNPNKTKLEVALSYTCADINKYNMQLTSRVVEKFRWHDPRLTWTPKDYEDITHLRYPAKLLWTPDFKLYNSQNEPEVRDEVNAVIFNNGTVLWVPLATYKTHCLPLKRNTFACQLILGSWTYSTNTIDLSLDGPGLDKLMYLDSCPYDIIEPQAKVEAHTYPCCPDEKYAGMYVNFVLHDRA